jgi:hypothetical protein
VQHSSPEPKHKTHVEEIKDQRAAEDDRIIVPRAIGRHANACHGDGPWEHPEEVGAEGLEEVPAGDSGEEDGCQLVIEGVENVAPVYCLCGMLVLVYCSGSELRRVLGRRRGSAGTWGEISTFHIVWVIEATVSDSER